MSLLCLFMNRQKDIKHIPMIFFLESDRYTILRINHNYSFQTSHGLFIRQKGNVKNICIESLIQILGSSTFVFALCAT